MKKGKDMPIFSEAVPGYFPSAVLTAPVKPSKRPGRRKRVGTIDTSSGHVMWFLGYCNACDGKVLADRQTIDGLKVNIRRQQKSLIYRLLKRLLAHYER